MTTSTTPHPLAGYSEPGEDEQKNYFHGLSGDPRLVARTSTTVWARDDIYFPPHRNVLATLGDHEIVQKWCPSLRNALISVLTNADDGHGGKIAWTSFYPIRFGRDHLRFDKYNNPVVLLVGVRKEGIPTWSAALRAALQCRDRLRMFGIRGVEVEIKTSSIGPQSSSAAQSLASNVDFTYAQPIPPDGEPDPVSAEINSAPMPLLPFLGHRVEQEPERHPGEPKAAAGSMGLFLRLGSDTSVTYGRTCRHVAVGSRVPPNDDIRETQPGGLPSGLHILSGGALCAYDCARGIKNAVSNLKTVYLKTRRDFFKHPDDEEYALLYQLQSSAQSYSEQLRKTILAQAGACDEQDAEATTSQRLVGTIAHSARHAVTEPGYFDDWALIKLAENKDTVNKVYAAGSLAAATMSLMAQLDFLQHVQYQPLKLDEQGFLRVHGDDIPPLPAFEQDARLSHLVAKRGATSGLRFGLTNEIEAVRRMLDVSHTGGPLVSLHLLVLDFESGCFSMGGDSGSCVFDMSGQVIGIVDGGEKPTELKRYFVKYDTDDIVTLHDVSAVPSQTPIPLRFSELSTVAVAGISPPETTPNRGSEVDDVTFVTPIQWLLRSIAEFTGQEPSII